MSMRVLLASVVLSALAPTAAAQQSTLELLRPQSDFLFEELPDGTILAADRTGVYDFADWTAYVTSPFAERNGVRCGSSRLAHPLGLLPPSDCSSSNTTPAAQYHPTNGIEYQIPVVFHVIRRTDGTGEIPDALLLTQIDVLNEDYLAYGAGAPGTNTRIRFTLAGVTRSTNNTWYDDNGDYYNQLAWDPTRYLNIYTNSADGFLGYAYIPSGGGVVGNLWDRVVCYWASVGRPGPIGSPYDLGRTASHEVGHYLGLYHTFQGGCSSPSGCYQNGDLICDTNPESSPNFSPCTRTTCGSLDPTHNYMDYSDDVCMNQFTLDQARRMRCTLEHYRVDLAVTLPDPASNPLPANGSIGVPVTTALAWNAGSGTTSHDVYFGTDPALGAAEFQGNQTGTTFAPGPLSNDVTYFWRIDEVGPSGTTTGGIWKFTTESPGFPPDPATLPVPADGAAQVGRLVVLTWSAGSGAAAHNVHFGTSNPPPLVATQGSTSFDPGALDRNQTYFWRIDEVNSQGTTAGPVWSFTTSRNFGRDKL